MSFEFTLVGWGGCTYRTRQTGGADRTSWALPAHEALFSISSSISLIPAFNLFGSLFHFCSLQSLRSLSVSSTPFFMG